MKISELLGAVRAINEAKQRDAKIPSPKKPASRLASAPSINDEPGDVEGEVDDADDSNGAISDLKAKMGSMGGDLYSISAYNYDDEFSKIGPNKVVRRMLDAVDNPVISDYWQYDNMDITNDKIVSAVILNDRNDEFITFYCGAGVNKFEPGDVQQLVRDGVIDNDQVSVLQQLKQSGEEYKRTIGRVEWKAGYEARNSRVYDDLNGVIDALRLPQLPREQVVSYHDLERETPDEREAAIQRILAKRKEKEAQKNAGPGREKR